jgi:hypothetical protein
MVPLMSLSQVTRNCDHLQAIMMNYRHGIKRWTQLHYCAANGLLDSVHRLLNLCNINKNARDIDGSTFLILAARKNYTDVMRLLITHGADVTVRNNVGQTALHWASVHGNIDALRLLVEKCADIEGQCARKNRALHNAAIRGFMPFVQELVVNHGADTDAKNENGDTPLSLSSKGHGKTELTRHDEVCEFLQYQMVLKNQALAALSSLSSSRVVDAAHDRNDPDGVVKVGDHAAAAMKTGGAGQNMDASILLGAPSAQPRYGHLSSIGRHDWTCRQQMLQLHAR